MWMINLAGLLLIVLIVWWFWLYKPKDTELGDGKLLVLVENGVYFPARIKIKANEKTVISFLRKDASPCAEMVIFPDFEISESLPVNKQKGIELPPMNSGIYKFHCQMQMYRGEVYVE